MLRFSAKARMEGLPIPWRSMNPSEEKRTSRAQGFENSGIMRGELTFAMDDSGTKIVFLRIENAENHLIIHAKNAEK